MRVNEKCVVEPVDDFYWNVLTLEVYLVDLVLFYSRQVRGNWLEVSLLFE